MVITSPVFAHHVNLQRLALQPCQLPSTLLDEVGLLGRGNGGEFAAAKEAATISLARVAAASSTS